MWKLLVLFWFTEISVITHYNEGDSQRGEHNLKCEGKVLKKIETF